jgi:dihydrofolate reductase/thymidylate synthase
MLIAYYMQVLHINPQKKDIDSFVFEDFTLEGYTPHTQIAMKRAV